MKPFDPTKVPISVTKDFLATEGRRAPVHGAVEQVTAQVASVLTRQVDADRALLITRVGESGEGPVVRLWRTSLQLA